MRDIQFQGHVKVANLSSGIAKLDASLIEHRIFRVVAQAVGHHQIEVSLNISELGVFVAGDVCSYGSKVHRLFDNGSVVFYLSIKRGYYRYSVGKEQ